MPIGETGETFMVNAADAMNTQYGANVQTAVRGASPVEMKRMAGPLQPLNTLRSNANVDNFGRKQRARVGRYKEKLEYKNTRAESVAILPRF